MPIFHRSLKLVKTSKWRLNYTGSPIILSNGQEWIFPNALNLSANPVIEISDTTEKVPAVLSQEEPLVNLETVEKRHILRVLEATHGNRTKAAGFLDISTRTLSNKLKQYALCETKG